MAENVQNGEYSKAAAIFLKVYSIFTVIANFLEAVLQCLNTKCKSAPPH